MERNKKWQLTTKRQAFDCQLSFFWSLWDAWLIGDYQLIKLFPIFHLCIGNELFDALFVLFLADQENIAGLGHDAIIDALYDGEAFRIVEGNDIAVALVHYRFPF